MVVKTKKVFKNEAISLSEDSIKKNLIALTGISPFLAKEILLKQAIALEKHNRLFYFEKLLKNLTEEESKDVYIYEPDRGSHGPKDQLSDYDVQHNHIYRKFRSKYIQNAMKGVLEDGTDTRTKVKTCNSGNCRLNHQYKDSFAISDHVSSFYERDYEFGYYMSYADSEDKISELIKNSISCYRNSIKKVAFAYHRYSCKECMSDTYRFARYATKYCPVGKEMLELCH